MPEIAEAPPGVQAAKKTVIEPSGLIARSMADQFAENPKGEAAAGEPKPDFAKLAAAQAKDKGLPAATVPDEKPAPPSPPPTPGAPPKVPGLPQMDEFRPRRQKAAEQWDALKAEHSEELAAAKAERDMIRQELAAAKASVSSDMDALRKEAQQYREILKDVAIERHPDFKARFEPREKTAIEAAKLAAGENGNKLEKLLKSPPGPWRDEQIEAITAELSKSSQIRVESAIRMLDQIDLEKQSEIATQRASFDLKQSNLLNQQKTQAVETSKKMLADFEAVQKQWTDPNAGHPMFVEREGDKEHNEGVQKSLELARELAKTIFSGEMSSEDVASVALWTASGERLLKGWQADMRRAEKAEKALDKMRGVQPGQGKPGQVNGSDADMAPQPGSPGHLRYMNNGLQEAQRKDSGRG